MKYFYTLFLLLLFGAACNQKALSGKELEDKLKKTMTKHLQETMKPGTEVTVKDVIYYPEKMKDIYICTFVVRIKTPNTDTTGSMMALISRDFKKVTRTQ